MRVGGGEDGRVGDKRVGGVHVDVGCGLYRIVGNFRGRKLSQISRFCGYSLRNLGAWQKQAIHEVFSAEIIFFTNL